jgi:hypothetical protein
MKLPGVCISNSICEGCRNRSISELRMLRLDYVDLTQILPPSSAMSQVKIFRPKPESMPPLNLPAFTLRHHIAHVVLLADHHVREHYGPRLAPPTREGAALDHALRHLETRVGDLAALGVTVGYWDPSAELTTALDGPSMLLLFGELHRRARVMLGLNAPTLTLPGECPNCQVAALRQRADEPQRVWCQACKSALDRDSYLDIVSLRIRP